MVDFNKKIMERKRIVIFLGHPAHFHLFRNVVKNLEVSKHKVFFVIKKKDILETLLKESGYDYVLIREGRKDSKLSMLLSVLMMDFRMWKFIIQNDIQLLVGTTLSFATKYFTKCHVIITNEDDAKVVPLYTSISYPFASAILNPIVCDSGKWNKKAIKYNSYQELAYLHPNHFSPDFSIVEKYLETDKPYFIMRFAKLSAHHDNGVKGIDDEMANRIIQILKPHGNIYITSERSLDPQFEPYRMPIAPIDMHHVMAFADIYIGDSQTMAAEAGVLGVPFIRYNDFAGKIGYLNELENKYKLGFGIKSGQEELLLRTLKNLLDMPNRREVFQERRIEMLKDKIDYAKFLTWFIENFPQSRQIMQERTEYQYNFKLINYENTDHRSIKRNRIIPYAQNEGCQP